MCKSSPFMILSIIASLLLYQVLGDPVIGGRFAEIYSYPWLASIQREDRHKCGGSIISSNTILTAAHCAKHPPESYVVRVGSTRTDSGGSWHSVVAIRRHRNYNVTADDVMNDVALMKVSPPIELGRYGAQIQLATRNYKVPLGTTVNIVGWGSTSAGGGRTSYELKAVELRIIDSGECARAYGDETGSWINITHQICTYGYQSGSCNGDSGGPLVTKEDIQVGIIFGSIGCGDQRYPGMYQDVAHYRDWIDHNSKNW